ncbi:uncharacterized protein LOC110189401 [Drosophila serrata]|uniref:uncharacterized protein LOC110189401 n=1 Tax=Drosophila serrata TaxID=7274 RepID=UPI000A1D1AA2|nr:uncharacterized protein LOC110189401 [Drosophila serrata]
MEIINASKTKKLNSQITCTSYYDFLTKEHASLEAMNCMDIQRDPSSESGIEDPLGSVMESAKYYDVDDNATEWYLGTRALSAKNPLVCQRQRRLKATSYSVPGRRVSPEFLSLLKQHHTRMRGHMMCKCKRPKVSFSYYKYDPAGKRRHMRPGIDTAAPLEFPYPMEKNDLEYRRRLLRGQELDFSPSAPFSFGPKRSKKRRVRHTRDKWNQNKYMNPNDLTWLYVDNLELPSTTEEARESSCSPSQKDLNNKNNCQENIETKTSNPSDAKPAHKPPKMKTFIDRLTKCTCPSGQGVVPSTRRNRRHRDPRLMDYFKSAFLKVFQGCSGEVCPRNEGSNQSRCSQCFSAENNSFGETVLDGCMCQKNSVNSSQRTDLRDNNSRGILRNRSSSKASALNSDFRQKKKVSIANCKCRRQKLPETSPNGSNINPIITEQEYSRLAETEKENPNFSGNSPDNSEIPYPCKGHSCSMNVPKPSSGQHLKTKQSNMENPDKFSNTRKFEKPKRKTEVRKACLFSKVKQRVPPKEDQNFNQEKTCKCQTHKYWEETNPHGSEDNPEVTEDQNHSDFYQQKICKCQTNKYWTETNPYWSEMNMENTEQRKSRSAEREEEKGMENSRQSEKPNFSGNSQDNNKKPVPCKGCSCTQTDQSKFDNPPNSRNIEEPKVNSGIQNACPCYGAKQLVPLNEDHNYWYCRQENSAKGLTQTKLTNTNPSSSKIIPKITEQEELRLSGKEIKKPKFCSNRPDNSGRPLRCKKSSCTRNVAEPSCSFHLKSSQSKKIHLDNPFNSTKVQRSQVTPNVDPKRNKNRIPAKPAVTRRFVKNEQVRKCVTHCPRDCKVTDRNVCLEVHRNLMRCPSKPIPIRCDPITKKCVPFPHSSGNERTDFLRWLYTRPNSGRSKRYTKTRKTPRKGLSCDPCRVQQQRSSCVQQETQKGSWERSESCSRCPLCSSVIQPRCQENPQRCCPHRKRWHCKETCQENIQGSFPWSCQQTRYASTVSRYCGLGRIRGGIDFQKDDVEFIPRRKRDVSHSFSTNLTSEKQVKYRKPRKWSMHAFSFD